MSESKPKKLAELTVVHLRGELEKRNINKNGVKAELYERLEKALKEEGQDPETYLFELIGKGISKRSRRGDGDESVEVSEDDKDESNSQEDKEKDNEITDKTKTEEVEDDQNPCGEKEEKNNRSITVNESITSQNKEENIIKESIIKENLSNESQIDKNVILVERKDDITNKENVKEPHITPKKSNLNEDTLQSSPGLNKLNHKSPEENNTEEVTSDYSKFDSKPTSEKKSQLKSEDGKLKQNDIVIESQKEEKSSVDANNSIDNEDSLNLTIGEDEDNFLGDEEEISQDKDQKDEIHSGGEQNKNAQGEKKQEKSSNEDKDVKSGGTEEEDTKKHDKAKKPTTGSNSSRNLWISGLSSITRANDLKQIFTKFGKVVGAKVVTNARTPGARCYGFVTMTCSEDASKAIESLHLTELHGRMISVEKAGPPKRSTENKNKEQPSPQKEEEKKKEHKIVRRKHENEKDDLVPPGTEDFDKAEPAAPGTENDVPVEGESKDMSGHHSRSSDRAENRPDGKRPRSKTSSHRSYDHSVSKHRRTSPNVLTFSKIKEERDKQRIREKERMFREEERRRDTEKQRQREIERKQRDEFIRLEREKHRLRMEREKVERERSELLKLKRERQRLERERANIERIKLEREKEELERLKRQTLNQLEEERRKSSLNHSRNREYESSRKRPATEVLYESSHSRFSDNREYKKENSHKSGEISNSRRAYESDTRARAWEESGVKVREDWPKERDSTRYTEGSGSSFRPQEESRSKSDRHPRDRYQDSSKGDRYSERTVESWHGSSAGTKSFSGGRDSWVSGTTDRSKIDSSQSWARPSGNSNRWSGSGPMNNRGPQGGSGSMFPQNIDSGIPGLGMMSMGPYSSSGTNRFDSYKLPY